MKSVSTLIVQLTDTHLFDADDGRLCGIPTAASAAAVAELIGRRHGHPDAILATGDLSQDESTGSYARFRTLVEPFGAPVYALPGNHDDPSLLKSVLWAPPVTAGGEAEANGWDLVLLDSTVPGDPGGRLSDAELDRLDRTLARHATRPALVSLHHHPLPSGASWLDTMILSNASAFFGVLDRHPRVKAVVSGHIHQAFEGERKGVRYFAAPSTCLQFTPGAAAFSLDSRPPGYRWFRLGANGAVESGVERIEPGRFTPDPDAGGY